MGYDVHIARAAHWVDAETTPITLPEWLQYVEGDSEMRLEGVAVGRVKGKRAVAYQSTGLAVWVAYSKHDEKGNMAWFDWYNGTVVVKNPDAEIREKMKQIATALGAVVVGDDGEHY